MSAIDVYELSAPEKILKNKCTKKTPHFFFQNLKMICSKNIEIWSSTFKITATNVLNCADLWPNLDLFI